MVMGLGDVADLVGAYDLAVAHGNGTAQEVYRKRLAALGLDERGVPMTDQAPKAPAGETAPAAEARAAAAAGDETAASTPPKARKSPRARQSQTTSPPASTTS